MSTDHTPLDDESLRRRAPVSRLVASVVAAILGSVTACSRVSSAPYPPYPPYPPEPEALEEASADFLTGSAADTTSSRDELAAPTSPSREEPAEHPPATTFAEEAQERCQGDDDDTRVRDCRLYVPVEYGPPITYFSESQPDAYGDAVAYSHNVFSALSDRLHYADSRNMDVDPSRLSTEEQSAFDFIGTVQRAIRPRLVVTATSINVHRRAGAIHARPVSKLNEGDVVFFCGGHPGITKPDPVEVPWYWVDREGRCDRSKPKDFIASQEVRAGRVFWLVRWHDYDMRFARHHRRKAREEGRNEDRKRYDRRIRRAPADILAIAIDGGLIEQFLTCALGVTSSRYIGGWLKKGLIAEAGGTSTAHIAGFVTQATSGAPPALIFDQSSSTSSILTSVIVGGALASLIPGFEGWLVGTAVCVGGLMFFDYLRSHDDGPQSVSRRRRKDDAPSDDDHAPSHSA